MIASGVFAKVKSTSSELPFFVVDVVPFTDFAALSLLSSFFFDIFLLLLFLENKRIAAAEIAVTADATTITCFLSTN